MIKYTTTHFQILPKILSSTEIKKLENLSLP